MLIELFSLGDTAKALRANRLEIKVFELGWSVSTKISRGRGGALLIISAQIDRPVNALQLSR